MRVWEHRSFTTLHFLVAGTGFGYIYLKYFTASDSSFAIIQHPWQSPLMAIHIVTSGIFAVFYGILLRSHIIPQLRRFRPENRLTGLISFSTFIVMALSGYLLQVSSTSLAIEIWTWIHISTGSLFAITYTLHFVLGNRIRKQRTRIHSRVSHV